MGKRKTGGMLGNNDIEDVRWLCSLSESELDMLIALKMLVMRRAKIIGHPSLAKEFDLKKLRHLSFTMMEHLKEQLKDLSAGPDSAEGSKLLDECNLSRLHVNDSFSSMSMEELRKYICPKKSEVPTQEKDKSSRTAEKSCEDETPTKKRKVAKKRSCEDRSPRKKRSAAKKGSSKSCKDRTHSYRSCKNRTPT